MTPIPVPPTRLPGLPALLSGDLWPRWAQRGAVFPIRTLHESVRYVRLKPATSCRVVVLADDLAGQPPAAFLLHLYADRARALEAFGKLAARADAPDARGFVPFVDEEHAIVVAPFPLDPELPALRHVYRRFRLKQALGELLPGYARSTWRYSKSRTRAALLAYKPGRRAVLRVTVHLERRDGREAVRLPLHVKVEHEATVVDGYRKLLGVHTAARGALGWAVPRPLGWHEERGLVVRAWSPGRALDSLLDDPDPRAHLEAAGRALAGLHGLELDPGHPGSALDAGSIRDLARDLAELLPGDRHRVTELGERLAGLASRYSSGPRVVVHGDFHPGQVILGLDGPVLVDFDRAGSGHRALDLGSFLAYAIEAGLAESTRGAFLDGYRRAAARPVDLEAVEAATAAALFRRVVVPLRRFDPDWPERMRRRLASIERRLGARA